MRHRPNETRHDQRSVRRHGARPVDTANRDPDRGPFRPPDIGRSSPSRPQPRPRPNGRPAPGSGHARFLEVQGPPPASSASAPNNGNAHPLLSPEPPADSRKPTAPDTQERAPAPPLQP